MSTNKRVLFAKRPLGEPDDDCFSLDEVATPDLGPNEILIKKHTDENDIIMHTQAAGSPYCIIKNAKDKMYKTILAANLEIAGISEKIS